MIRRTLRNWIGTRLISVWCLLFRRLNRRAGTTGKQLDAILGRSPLGRRFPAMQVRSEIEALLGLLETCPPRAVLEIGTANGGTLWLLTRVASPDAVLVSVDLPRVAPDVGYADWRERVYASFGKSGQRVSLIRGDSHRHDTFERVRAALDGRTVDFLLIDGDHSYEGVRADWEMYRALLSPHGVVAFHDIVPGAEERVGGVPRFWKEVRASVASRELVASWGQGGYGFGVIDAGSAPQA
jgi:predicted O-methyltransferase YrrM